MIHPNQEFFDANQGRLGAISDEIGRILDVERSFEVRVTSSDMRAVMVYSGFTPDAIIDASDGGYTREEAVALSKEENRHQVTSVLEAVRHTMVTATLHDIGVTAATQELPEDYKPDALSFEEAVSRNGMVDDGVTIGAVHFKGIPKYGSGATWYISRADTSMRQDLGAVSLDERTIQLSYKVRPLKDERLGAWKQALGPVYGSVILTAAGDHETEADLDARLQDIAELFAGTQKETEALAAIAGIRERAIAVKASREMTIEHGLDLPTVGYLEDTLDLLRSY